MKIKTFIIIAIITTLILIFLNFTFTYAVSYPMYLKNCKEILNAEYLTPTEDYADCVRVIAYPFYNYWLEVIIFVPILSILIVGAIFTFIGTILGGLFE